MKTRVIIELEAADERAMFWKLRSFWNAIDDGMHSGPDLGEVREQLFIPEHQAWVPWDEDAVRIRLGVPNV